MLPRPYRLRQRSDFERLRREGKKVNHPLAVLVYCRNDHRHSRFAFTAGRHIGGAVERNRAKRRLREAVRSHLAAVSPGWDCLIIARTPTAGAPFSQLEAGVRQLLTRAGILGS